MHTRIKELRSHFNLTQQDFADRLGIKRNTVATYEMGRSVPSDAVIILICREFGVNESWLRTGEGEMTTVSSRDEELAAFFGRVLADRPDSVRRRLVYALSRLDDSGWELADRMIKLIAEEEKPED